MSAGPLPDRLPPWLAPLLLPDELAAGDRYAIEHGTPGIALMKRAGAALARTALQALPPGPVAVLCGPGNNGGDGLVAARVLHEAGREVHVRVTRDPGGYRGDAALALDGCPVPVVRFDGALPPAATGAIDALLGTGARGVPRDAEAQAVAALAAVPVVACDLPTGIDAADGTVPGEAVRAVATVTFHRPSPGHLVHPAKAYVGRLVVADIGIPTTAPLRPAAGAIRDRVIADLPRRDASAHKYRAGAVLAVAGSARYPGAASLTVRGAQRGGAGYVTAYVHASAAPLVHAAAPEAIVQAWATDAPRGLEVALRARADAVVLGPGLGDDVTRSALCDVALRSDRPVVLDADGLGVASGRPEALRRPAPLVLTPHAGELGRLLGTTSEAVGAARLTAAREAAQRADALVVLKGDDTIVAAPDGRVAVNDLPAPALATAGTGDVLAGLLGALLAGGADPWPAACGAVRLHARAGRLAAARAGSADGVVALDVAELLPAARLAVA